MEELQRAWRESPLLSTYAFYGGLLVAKMTAMSLVTVVHRLSSKAFANPEDAVFHPKGKLTLTDPNVERVRRAHQNDLENIPPFLLVSFLFLLTEPEPGTALWLFRVFAAARLTHTLAYLAPRPNALVRVCGFTAGVLVTAAMAWRVLTTFCSEPRLG